MATLVFAQNHGAQGIATYDPGTLVVSQITIDATGDADKPINYSVAVNGTEVTSGTVQPGTLKTYNVPAGQIVLATHTGPSGSGVGLPPGLQISTWT